MMIHNQEMLITVAWNMIGSFVLTPGTQYTPPCMKSAHFYFKIAFSITTYLRLIKLNQNFLWLKYSYLMPLVQQHQLVKAVAM